MWLFSRVLLSRVYKLIGAGFVALSLVILIVSQQRGLVRVPVLHQQQCSVSHSQGDKTFAVYFPSDWKMDDLTQLLCQKILVGSEYATVIGSWAPRQHIDTNTVLNTDYQLLWNRPHVLRGLLPGFADLYSELEPLMDYEIHWFSHAKDFEISQDYFDDHHLGLLADAKSQSGHQIPLTEIRQKQIHLNPSRVHYYPNRDQLVHDFLLGKLDIIANVKLVPPLKDWPEPKSQKITTSSMGGWFIERSVDSEVQCSLKQLLQQLLPQVAVAQSKELGPC